MNRVSRTVFLLTTLTVTAVACIAILDWRPGTSEVAQVPAPTAGSEDDRESMTGALNEAGGATSSDGSETVPESTESVVATELAADNDESPLSGRGVAVAFAEEQAARTSSPVHGDFERFVNEERVDYWAESTESLILDGINFSAFGSAYADWAVECRATMCLTVASIDADTYNTQQFLPQGGWMDAMRTIHNDIAPVLPLSGDGASGMHRDPETGRIWMLELWWLRESE